MNCLLVRKVTEMIYDIVLNPIMSEYDACTGLRDSRKSEKSGYVREAVKVSGCDIDGIDVLGAKEREALHNRGLAAYPIYEVKVRPTCLEDCGDQCEANPEETGGAYHEDPRSMRE